MRVRAKRQTNLSGLDQTVYDIVREYLDSLAEDSTEDFNVLSSLRQLKVSEVINLCQNAEMRLRRVKKALLTESAEKAMASIRQEELKRAQEQKTPSNDDSDLDIDESQLMDVQEANQMNKSVVNLWKVGGSAPSSADPSANPSPSAATPVNDLSTPIDSTAEVVIIDQVQKRKPDEESKDTDERKSKKKKSKKPKSEFLSASSVRLADLGGIEPIINQVLEMVAMPLSHPEVYSQIGSDIPRGVLLHGPPGCGKTMLANALANELDVAFLSISAPSIVSGMSGESEKKLREIFEEAKSLAPCLVFIDEIDAITPKRESVQREMERRIVAQLLTCMDDVSLEKTNGKPVMIIGATNRPDSIDPALRRGGRFDRELCMNVPDQDSRQRILQTMCSKLKVDGSFDFKKLAKMTPGYVGADLQALVSAAGVCAIKRIFKQLSVVNETDMDVDEVNSASAVGGGANTATQLSVSSEPPSAIRQFLAKHPDPLTPEELAPLTIAFEDFLTAIPSVQPSSKREGFATVPDITWADVGAMGPIREELEYAIVEPIRNPELYGAAGINAPSGVLLWGPPGCGKTLLAKAVANESQANFISVRGPELLNKYVGESERAVRQVFVRARASVPCVIFFDELDALVPRRDDSNSESSSRVVNTLLTELDGVGDRKGVYVIAATNRPDMIDNAMLRPGRLDKQLLVELPSAEERFEILKTVTRSSPLDPEVDLHTIAHDERCRNFSGADLANLNREAAVHALKKVFKDPNRTENAKVLVTMEDFETAFGKVKASVTDRDREKYRRLAQIKGA